MGDDSRPSSRSSLRSPADFGCAIQFRQDLARIIRSLAIMSFAMVGSVQALAQPQSQDRSEAVIKRLKAARSTYERPTLNWVEGSSQLWQIKDIGRGNELRIVDPASGTSRTVADARAISGALTKAGASAGDWSVRSVSSTRSVPTTAMGGKSGAMEAVFEIGGAEWRCSIGPMICSKSSSPGDGVGELVSPDGKWSAYLVGNDLQVRSRATGATRLLTTGLTTDFGLRNPSELSGPAHVLTEARFGVSKPPLRWSADSRFLLGNLYDYRNVRKLTIIQSSPSSGLEPVVFSYRKPHSEDADIGWVQTVVYDPLAGERWRSPRRPSVKAYEFLPIWGDQTKSHVYWVEWARGERTATLKSVDLSRSDPKETAILTQTGTTPVDFAPHSISQDPIVRELPGGHELLIWSERNGTGHIYVIDAKTGAFKRDITAGDLVVFSIEWIDLRRERIFFLAGDNRPGGNPYHNLLYSTAVSGIGAPRLLTRERADHQVSGDQGFNVSQDGMNVLDTFSTVDTPPRTVVRSLDDGAVSFAEAGTIAKAVSAGWVKPEPFACKAADGVTDVYGVMYKPFNFDPSKRYAVIDDMYPGHFKHSIPTRFLDYDEAERQALADLGFIVVVIDGRGTSFRTRAFHDFGYGNWGFAGIADHVAAITQLAASRPYLDIRRVGSFGNSAGGDGTIRAMLDFPEFFKVGVASGMSGATLKTHEPAYGESWFASNYTRWDPGPAIKHLKGRLMLLHGELDDHANPAFALQLAAAAQAADVRLDVKFIPNVDHDQGNLVTFEEGIDGYFRRSLWGYFLDHLGGPVDH